jgi:tetratricopeptide (TPR) repeat protein
MLTAAIQAARQGQREAAREQLTALLELDENNEQAWLWLSGVMDEDADRRVCLENVLTLNPDNGAARQGLAKLDAAAAKKRVVKKYAAPSPATVVLYPERLTKEWEWSEPELTAAPAAQPAIQSHSSFNDLWNGDDDLCAYCAAPLRSLADERKCPHCKRTLIASYYRYPKPSVNMHVYWVMLLGLGQLFLIQLFIDLILRAALGTILLDLIVAFTACGLAVGVYFRQHWAYLASIIFLFFVSLIISVNLLSGGLLANVLAGGEPLVIGDMALLTDTFETVLTQMLILFQPFQLGTAVIALIAAIFFIAPDFERVKVRQAAHVDRGVSGASGYYAVGKEYAQQGMWATAVRHFQRAAANDPLRASYAKALGEAYAKLGFRERAADTLQTAHRLATHPEIQAEIAAELNKLAEV